MLVRRVVMGQRNCLGMGEPAHFERFIQLFTRYLYMVNLSDFGLGTRSSSNVEHWLIKLPKIVLVDIKETGRGKSIAFIFLFRHRQSNTTRA